MVTTRLEAQEAEAWVSGEAERLELQQLGFLRDLVVTVTRNDWNCSVARYGGFHKGIYGGLIWFNDG